MEFRFHPGCPDACSIGLPQIELDRPGARSRIGRGLREEELQRKPQQRSSFPLATRYDHRIPSRATGLGVWNEGAIGCPGLDDLVVGGDFGFAAGVRQELLSQLDQQAIRIEPGIFVTDPAGCPRSGEGHPRRVRHDGPQRRHQPFDERRAARTGEAHAGTGEEVASDRLGVGTASDVGQTASGSRTVAGQESNQLAHHLRVGRQPGKHRPGNEAVGQERAEARRVAPKPSAVDEFHPEAEHARIDHRAIERRPSPRLPSRLKNRNAQAIEGRADCVQERGDKDGVGPARRLFADRLQRRIAKNTTPPGVEGEAGRLQCMLQQPTGFGMVTGFGGRQTLDELGTAVDEGAYVALEKFDR